MKELSKRDQELIRKASIDPSNIFEHMDALNEEIAETYDMDEASKIAAEDPTLKDVKSMTKSTKVTEKEEEAAPKYASWQDEQEDMLAKEAAAAEALLKQQKEAMRQAQEQQAKQQEQKEELSPEEQQREAILELLSGIDGAPGPRQIAALKQKYGDDGIHVLALGEKDVYIFTYLRRGQWQQIQKIIQAAQGSDLNQNPEELMKEKVIQYTVLWPKGISSPEFLYNSRAGVMDTLYQTVLLNSYFLSPQQAMMLTSQL